MSVGNISKRNISAIGALLVSSLLWVSPASAQDAQKPDQTEDQKLEEKIKEMGRELSRIVMDNLKTVLDQELKKVKRSKGEPKDPGQLPVYEEALKKNPKDADAHMALGRIYDEMEDGANAIIHTKKAEELYLAKSNIKGTAEARRNLRNYYEKYGFKPEDFNVSK